MVATPSTMLPLGSILPPFTLSGPDATTWSTEDVVGAPVLVVAFLCPHCPYVKHVEDRFGEVTADLMNRGAAVVAVQSNAVEDYPQDGPAGMAAQAVTHGFRFPYLLDASQEVAKAFRAACTPDFFVFDGEQRLAYRGQFDDSRPGKGHPVTGADLVAAVEALLDGGTVTEDQVPSIGCSIKWRAGDEPDYVG
ncbi:MAG TPA: thioredoxin family protein [Acidimicrobiales bacterium]